MEHTQIKFVIDYIEDHLKEELDNKTLAQVSGYSEYHFIRVFRKHVHLTPADYIRKRRISEIVRRIGEKKRTMSDIAFEYGFNSKENFTRGFKKEYNILPTEWKTANCSLRLFMPFSFEPFNLQTMETNPALPWYATPIVLLSATFVGGGNEELGWRGILQPELERKFPFPVATLITGCVWMAWHIPLWFVEGTSQQNMDFGQYAIYGLILSFWLATIYKKTNSVFFCAIFHGFANLLLSFFVIKINWILVVGLIVSLVISLWLYDRRTPEKEI